VNGRRIPNIEMLNSEIAAWESEYNSQRKCIDWQFTTEDARVKLRMLHPVFQVSWCSRATLIF